MTIIILNATQHVATPEQMEAGLINPAPELAQDIRALLTFEAMPSPQDIYAAATQLSGLVASWAGSLESKPTKVMIGGAPWFMSPLETALRKVGMQPVYAFSRRESVEITEPDGSVVKAMVFRHQGFIEAGAV